MALRVGLTKSAVIQAATELADAVGLDALTLGMLADRLRVRTPTLYHYLPRGITGLQRELAPAKRSWAKLVSRHCWRRLEPIAPTSRPILASITPRCEP